MHSILLQEFLKHAVGQIVSKSIEGTQLTPNEIEKTALHLAPNQYDCYKKAISGAVTHCGTEEVNFYSSLEKYTVTCLRKFQSLVQHCLSTEQIYSDDAHRRFSKTVYSKYPRRQNHDSCQKYLQSIVQKKYMDWRCRCTILGTALYHNLLYAKLNIESFVRS